MSADYEGVCPKCVKTKDSLLVSARQEVDDGYGKLSKDAYAAAQRNLIELEESDEEDFRTLPEYYEFYIRDDVLHGDWSAVCRVCGWSAEANFEKPLTV